MTRALVCGGRNYRNRDGVFAVLELLARDPEIAGGAADPQVREHKW